MFLPILSKSGCILRLRILGQEVLLVVVKVLDPPDSEVILLFLVLHLLVVVQGRAHHPQHIAGLGVYPGAGVVTMRAMLTILVIAISISIVIGVGSVLLGL